MRKLFESSNGVIEFKVSDMVRGKCMFNSVAKINNCATSIIVKIRQIERQGGNIRLVEIDNRLSGITCDLVLKIQINESIC